MNAFLPRRASRFSLRARTLVSRSFALGLSLSGGLAGEAVARAPVGPSSDHVGFPATYRAEFQVLRAFNKTDALQVVTVYGNASAASVTNLTQVPFPYGSVLVMETAAAAKDPQGKPILDSHGNYRPDKVAGMHVMRREKNFGNEYGADRSGEWDFVGADGSYLTPPDKSSKCAACHLKAGVARDFVYRAGLPAASK